MAAPTRVAVGWQKGYKQGIPGKLPGNVGELTVQGQRRHSEMALSKEKANFMLDRMLKIRYFEEMLKEIHRQKVPGMVHLYIGEEAVAVGMCAALRDQDYITSTHRGHGHVIAKGARLDGMMAELFGRKTGLCQGKGGSMHVADVSNALNKADF